jgi:hypothetical protein
MKKFFDRIALSRMFTGLRATFLSILAIGGLCLATQPAFALTANVCMQTNYTNHGLSQTLGCTANDVRVATATNIDIVSGGECHTENGQKVCTCNQGGTVTFSADYTVELTAQARYDIGIYFGVDGDANNDGALTGACKLTTLDSTNSSNFINLDPTLTPASKAQPRDVCGDIDAAHNPQLLHLTLATACTPDPATGNLKLPNCTSWRESGANTSCEQATDAYPGSPSKCNCEPGFTVGIFVETATLEVQKTVAPTTVPETGGSVVYSVSVKNLSQQATLTLDSLTDDKYGNITTTGHNGITATTCVPDGNTSTCEIGGTIAAGATCSCTFTANVPAGDAGGTYTDIVTAVGTDSFGHTGLMDDDDATVTYADVRENPSLTKTASALNCQVDTTYDVVVKNNSAQDVLTLNTLTDDKFGSITGTHAAAGAIEAVTSTTCGQASGGGTLPAQIAPSGTYTCSFVGRITSCSAVHQNTVTGTATDDDGASYDKDSGLSGSATVTISVTK